MLKEHAPAGFVWSSQAARELGFSIRTVQKYCQTKKFKARRIGSDWCVSIASVAEYKSKKKRK